MAVLFMVAFVVWGILSCFIFFGTLVGFLAQIRETFGRIPFLIVLALLGWGIMKTGTWERRFEEKAVVKFMTGWQEASHGVNSIGEQDMWSTLDFTRGDGQVPNDSDFVSKYCLESWTPVKQIGIDRFDLPADLGNYWEAVSRAGVKVFTSDVTLSGWAVEEGYYGTATVKFWVACDNHKIVKLAFK